MLTDLIKGLTILSKYENPTYPTYCEHDILYICISPKKVNKNDIDELEKLRIIADLEEDCFFSYRFGSAWIKQYL